MAESNDMGNSVPQPQTLSLATASLVLGILSIMCLGFFAGIPAVICGHMAKSTFKKEPEKYSGDGLATAGLILGYVGIAISLVGLITFAFFFAVKATHSAPFPTMPQSFTP